MVRMPPTFTRILSRVCLIPLAGAIALTTMAEAAPARPDVTDTAVTENVGRWGHRHVPDLAVSPDAKVGTSSITGVFGRTHYVSLAAPKTRPWNLTYVATLRFWAKADRPNGNILVMLCSNGFQNRRDRVVTVGTEWQLYELALDDKTFAKNVQGKADFTCVRSIVIYNNDATATRVWLDGFELVGEREGRMPVLQLPETSDDRVSVFRLAAVDPFPHLEEAQASRHVAKPRYDLPPVAFNRENAFTDALVDFDQPEGWTARVRDANGYMCLSEDQMLRAVPNLKIELVAVGDAPKVTLIPPKPIRIDRPFDLVECWAYGGKQGGALAFQFRRVDGSLFAAGTDYANTMDDVNPKAIGQFWNLVRIRLPEPIAAGAELLTVELTPKAPKREPDPTCLFHLDQLRVLSFSDVIGKPPPAFNNVGPVVDTFPTHPNGACPQTVGDVRTSVQQDGESYLLAYESDDGQNVTYAYTPTTGTLSDLTVKLPSDATFQPAAASGPVFTFGDRIADTTSDETIAATLRSQALRGDAVHVVWEYTREGHSQTITYQLRLKGKTLQIDASSEQRNLSRWRFGHAQGVRDPKVIEVPFMLYCPNVLLTHGLFVTYYSDWYVSNVSMLPYGGDAIIEDDAVWYNWRRDQSFAYHPRTDGQRHPFRERFYITASNTIDDVMLSVRNPPSPVKNTLKTRLYRMILASAPGIFRKTRALVDQYNTYGMTDAYVLFHAPLWFRRQAGSEAFCGGMNVSMLHEPEGGDRGLIDLFAHMKAMGIAPGYYDGYPARDYTDPEFRYDWCAYTPEGDWKRMWRCAGLKPWAFPELAATLYKKRARKFGTRVSYQDGMTSWIISGMSEYDHRFPESGTIRGTLQALATGWQRCRENVNGPVFSEGRGSDFFHAGLNDGDYSKLKGYWDANDCAQDRAQLFVDFRLRKLGPLSAPLSVNIGYAGFAGTNKIHFESWYSREESYRYLHHFLAAEMAFAAIGMLEPYWPIWDNPAMHFDKTMTSYFMIRQLQERYVMEPVAAIRYFDGASLLNTSDALRADVVKENRVHIRYNNGLHLWVNLNWDGKHWQVRDGKQTHELPPGGWYARQGDQFREFSALVNGNRVDYVHSPAYIYLDGHGRTVEVDGHRTDRQMVVWKTGPKAGQTLHFPPLR